MHLPCHMQAKEAKVWVGVKDRAHRPGLQVPKGVSTPLHHRLRLQISKLYRVCFYSRAYEQEYYLILVHLIHLLLHIV